MAAGIRRGRMTTTQIVLALLTGLIAGAAFAAIEVPIPAPPSLPGVMGIVGIYLGYKGINWLGVSVDVLAVLRNAF